MGQSPLSIVRCMEGDYGSGSDMLLDYPRSRLAEWCKLGGNDSGVKGE